jgi:hypothetical protein
MTLAVPDPMPIDEFLHKMECIRQNAIDRIERGEFGRPPFGNDEMTEASKRPEVIFFLQLGIYPEWREVHFLSRQIQRLDDPGFVYRIGQQIYDEAKHTKVLWDQLVAWGAEPDRLWMQPIYQWSAAFDFMDKLTHPAEYFACSNFIGEGLFLPTIMRPMAKCDRETFAVYVEHIMPDEPRHIAIGRDVILQYCTTHDIQQRVLKAAEILAKQYSIGYEAANLFATRAKQGSDIEALRDGRVCLPD